MRERLFGEKNERIDSTQRKARHWCIRLAPQDNRMESTISVLIGAAEQGDISAAGALFSRLYSELHGLSKR